MDDELMLVDDLENTVPVEEVVEEILEESPEIPGDESVQTYETTVGYDDTYVLEQMALMNESLLKLNGLMAALLFFTVATWVLQKVHRGVKEVMYIDRDN